MNPKIPLVVGVVAVVALAGALAYILLRGSPEAPRAAAPTAATTHASPSAPAPAPTTAAPATTNAATTSSAATRGSGRVRLTTPTGIAWTRRSVRLQARATGGAHDVRLEYRERKFDDWSPIPAARLSTENGAGVSLPLDTDARGSTVLVRWDMPGTTARGAGGTRDKAIGAKGASVWVRAVATSADGDLLASAPVIVGLTRYPPPWVDVRAPALNDNIVFSGTKSIHIAWSPAPLWYDLPDGRVVGVPIAGYAVDLVNRDDVDAGRLPPARIATTSTSYDLAVPPPSDERHAVIVRAIDVAGNVGLFNTPPPDFRSQSFVLEAPRLFATLHGNDQVPLRALDSIRGPVCFEYRFPGPNESGRFLPIAPGEVTNASGKPIAAWPITPARNGSLFHWQGLRRAPGFPNRPLTRVELQVVRTKATAHGCSAPVAVAQWTAIYWER